MAKEIAQEEADWEHETAYRLVDLYVKELIERKDRKVLDIEGLVEAYLYVLGRLKASEHEMDGIVKAIKEDMRKQPETPKESGISEAIKKKKMNEGLLKALESM